MIGFSFNFKKYEIINEKKLVELNKTIIQFGYENITR